MVLTTPVRLGLSGGLLLGNTRLKPLVWISYLLVCVEEKLYYCLQSYLKNCDNSNLRISNLFHLLFLHCYLPTILQKVPMGLPSTYSATTLPPWLWLHHPTHCMQSPYKLSLHILPTRPRPLLSFVIVLFGVTRVCSAVPSTTRLPAILPGKPSLQPAWISFFLCLSLLGE